MRLWFFWLLCSSTVIAVERSPNVIVILADDMAIADLASVNGGLSRTPNLDRLRQQSTVCVQGYSGSCVCAPARAALLTGRFPHRTGVVTLNMNRHPALTRLRHDETTIAEMFQAAGYRTGLIGKWHCGAGNAFGPRTHGFDEFEGFSGSQDLSYFRYRLTINDKVQQIDDQYLTDDLSDRAIQFVRRHQQQPFFLHLAHYAPHRPLEAPVDLIEFYRNRGEDENTAIIYAMIEVMDRGIGRLLQELDRLEIADRTVVVFASDNGPDPVTGTRFNGSLRGTKYHVWEGGIRVPLWFRWPARLPEREVQPPVHFVDVAPTLIDLCQLNIDADVRENFDGRSVAVQLIGNSDPAIPPPHAQERSTSERMYFWQWNRGRPNYTHNAAVRQDQWKLVRPYVNRKTNPADSGLRPQLFNLTEDPSETTDVRRRHPRVADRLQQRLAEWSDQVEQSRRRPTESQPASDRTSQHR